MVTWRKGCVFLPTLYVDYKSAKIKTIQQCKPLHVDDLFESVLPRAQMSRPDGHDAHYYPGFILSFQTVRDPWNAIMRSLIPSFILSIVNSVVFCIYTDTDRLELCT